MMYVLQSVPVTAVRSVDAAVALVASERSEVVPTVPVLVPHAAALPGASALLVPGANPTTGMSNGLFPVVVPGTRKDTASTFAGRSRRRSCGRGYQPSRMLAKILEWLSPSNGVRPHSISYRTTPAE